MVVTIAYYDKPDEILYSFSKVGDSVCIGRDKRKCEIALGINAQGVSRIHLKLELLSDGRLFARDTSTYGTGYDGGPLVVEREKELKLSVVLQIGSFFFIIKETNVKKESIVNPFLKAVEINSRKRVASKKTAVILEEGCVVEKRKVVNNEVEKLSFGTKDSGKEVARSTEVKDELASHLNSSLNISEIWIQEQDKKLVAKLGKEVKEKSNRCQIFPQKSTKTGFRKSGENKSEASVLTLGDSSENIGSVTRVSLQCDSSNAGTYDIVQDTCFPVIDSSIASKRQIMTESPANDSILAGAKEAETLDDIDAERLSKPLFSSTQLTSFHEKLTKSINESLAVERNNIPTFRVEQFSDLLESQGLGEKFCSLPFRTMPKQKEVINRQDTIGTGFISCLGMNTVKKRSNQFGNQSNTEEMEVISKRVRMEIMEDKIERQGSGKNKSLIESRTECEVNAGENDQSLGMNIETLRIKLRNAVQYENLERPVLEKIRSQSPRTNHWQEFNCKRFKKAAQGSHSGCGLLPSTITRIVDVTGLIDFREIV